MPDNQGIPENRVDSELELIRVRAAMKGIFPPQKHEIPMVVGTARTSLLRKLVSP